MSTSPSLVIVTGLSGAGNSTALHCLADAGMYCIDNLPMELLSPTIELLESGRIRAPHGLAVCMDVRDRKFAQKFPSLRKELANKIGLEVIFLRAEHHIIATRFSTTRRKHPLMEPGDTLTEVIDREREMLGPVEESADIVLDTSTWSPQQLARVLEGRFTGLLLGRKLHITITSFGFKYGPLEQVDMLFDMRFIDNPYFVSNLRKKSGLDSDVRSYVFSRENAMTMLGHVENLLRFSLPLYYKEGRHYIRIGIGCTGGRHRSVCFAEEIGRLLLKQPIINTITTILHRDIDR